MDFTVMVHFFPEIQDGLSGEAFVGKETFRGFASFDNGETFCSIQLDFIVSPDQFGFGIADASLHNPEGINTDTGKTFTIHGASKPIAYCRIV